MVAAEIASITMHKPVLTALFYGLIGLVASLALFLVFYWSLSLNASIYNLVTNFSTDLPLYFWPYIILTVGTIILFGINVPLFIYRVRKYGFPKFRIQGSTGLGSVIGVLASACPVCGSTLLSAIGIAGGLTAFPLGGLELKALSFGLMALPIVLTGRELSRFAKGGKACPVPRDASFKTKDKPWLLVLVVAVALLGYWGFKMLSQDPIFFGFVSKTNIINPNDNQLYDASQTPAENNPLYDEVVAKVLPERGFQSKIVLTDSIVKLVKNGVIDKQKFENIYKERGGLPPELKNVLTIKTDKRILLTRENANYYVNLLWPLGLSNYMSTNNKSPILGDSLFNFASTGGWKLGKEENGGAYFNKLKIVKLTREQEALVTKIAQNTYRPCCDNSTFFQDCNHGSALLGLLELGASQGLTEEELYREALAFNSFWFPHNYIQTALYFKVAKNTNWEDVNPAEVMGYDYSAVSNWAKNVQVEIAKIPNLLPQTRSGVGCGV
ncbi:hypothetical protein HYW54_02970 [Candidatus Gottesmanbacteria bacterium]|nr:hypothetical protein [Candidatus Gottesmanbacteria bacterium]